MSRNLRNFMGITILITVGWLTANDLVSHLPSGIQKFSSFLLYALSWWIFFDWIVKIIYKITGIPAGKNQRLTHRQSATLKRYWIAWLLTSLVSGLAYSYVVHGTLTKTNLIFGAVAVLLIFLAYLSNRQKIMGHTKKELFK